MLSISRSGCAGHGKIWQSTCWRRFFWQIWKFTIFHAHLGPRNFQVQMLKRPTYKIIWYKRRSRLRNVLRTTTACTFRHLNFQKWSENGVFCTFWLRNVLRVTTACNFSSLVWPAGSAPAALASLLFDPPEPQIIGKTQCFATFLPFLASASSFFLLFLFYPFF